MRNAAAWSETKFKTNLNGLSATRDTRHLAVGSRLTAQLVAEQYSRALPVHARGALLDLGCGQVPFFGAYRRWVERVTCVDWPDSLHPTPHVDVYCDLSRPLPMVDAVFDTVVFSDVLEHLPDPELAMSEIGRVLRPGGCLIMNTPFLYPIHEAPHDYLRHTRFSLQRLAENSGLRVVEIVEIGGALDILADTIAKFLGQIPVVGRIIATFVQRLAHAMGRSRFGRMIRQRSAPSYPLGYFCVAQRDATVAHSKGERPR